MTDPVTLIKRYCRSRDENAFRTFYRSQSDRLWRFLRARGADTETAYDLVAEAFTRFIQSICKDPRAPVAMLYRIAINLQIDEYRRAQTASTTPDTETAEQAPDKLETDESEAVRKLVYGLPENEQNLLLMRYWIGMTYKEIAEIVKRPEGTLRREGAALLKKLSGQWLMAHGDSGQGRK